jgi:hypothetical protein
MRANPNAAAFLGVASGMSISFQPILVETHSSDDEGSLVLADDKLVGVLVRLSDDGHDPALRGAWFLEAGFGALGKHVGAVFASLDEAERAIAGWVGWGREHPD